MSLNWRENDYFHFLLENEDAKCRAIQMLVDDLRRDKSNTIKALLTHCGSEDFLWALVCMLPSENTKVAGNAAYILGTITEEEIGQSRIMALINGPHPHKILADLTDLLSHEEDSESVMNAAGTIGTIADSEEGRGWILRDSYCEKMIKKITTLLCSGNTWTASNAALVLARLSIAEEGCRKILAHTNSQKILTLLIASLGVDDSGRGMNAAFAIGRLCDTRVGQERFLEHDSISSMIEGLCDMLKGTDSGCCKNSCYALSCLAGNKEGHKCLLDHRNSDAMIHSLSNHLTSEEREIGWFAAMTLRILAGRRRGVYRLRDHPDVTPQLEAVQMMLEIHEDTRKEVILTQELLRPLDTPDPPTLEVRGANDIQVTWSEVTLSTGQVVTYHLYCSGAQIYQGTAMFHSASGLPANSQHSFQLRVSTEGDCSPLSEAVSAKTEITVPNPPEALRIINVTPSQLRILWCPPTLSAGPIKGYVVYEGTRLVDTTAELNSIISGLATDTVYGINVCAFNHKGRGESTSIIGRTLKLGNHAPAKPCLQVLGRSAIHVTWVPPSNPLGRIHRYELTMDGAVVYSGWDLAHTVRGLTPITEYVFTVVAITSEGRCESDPARKRTPKQEYKAQSTAQRYFTHPPKATNQEISGDAKETAKSSKKLSVKRIPRRSVRSNSLSDDIHYHTSVNSKDSRSPLSTTRRNKTFRTPPHIFSACGDHMNKRSLLGSKPSSSEALNDYHTFPDDAQTRLKMNVTANGSPSSQGVSLSRKEREKTGAFRVRRTVKIPSVTVRQPDDLPSEIHSKLKPAQFGSIHPGACSERRLIPGNSSKYRHRRLSLNITKNEVNQLGRSRTCRCDQRLAEQIGNFKISSNGVVLYAEPGLYDQRVPAKNEEDYFDHGNNSTAGISGTPHGGLGFPGTKQSYSKLATLDLPIESAAVNNFHFVPTHLRTQPLGKPELLSTEMIRTHRKNSTGKPRLNISHLNVAPMQGVVCMQCQGVLAGPGNATDKFTSR